MEPNGGGGGPSNGPEPSPDGMPPVAPEVEYLPLADGASFTYVHSAGWVENLTVSSTTHDGQPAFLLSSTPDPDGERTESIFARSGSKVLRVKKTVFDTLASDALIEETLYVPGFLRADDAWSTATIGTTFTEAYDRTEVTGGQAGTSEPRSHTFTIEGFEEVVTNAGRFPNCVRVRRKRTWQTDVVTEEAQEKLFWYAPNVGKVQEETLNNGNTERLEAYTLP